MAAGIIEYGCKKPVIRRKHYRMDCFWNIECGMILSEEEQVGKDAWFTGMTTDISGGGCRFNSARQLNQDSTFIMKIKNPDKNKDDELSLKAKVIVSQLLANRREVYETRVRFIDISFGEQEQLIRWIFEEKRKFKWQERGLENEEKYFDY